MSKDKINYGAEVLSAMIDLHIHEDNMYWFFVRFLITIQLAFITAFNFIFEVSILIAIIIILIALIVSIILIKVTNNTRKNRNLNIDRIQKLAWNNLPDKLVKQFKNDVCEDIDPNDAILFTSRSGVRTGHSFVKILFSVFIVINILLLIFAIVFIFTNGRVYEWFWTGKL